MKRPGLDTSGVDHVIGYLLAVADVPARQVFQQHIGEPLGLKPVEFTLLVLLLANPGVAPKQLLPALRVPAPQVTLMLDRMAARGLVERRRHPSDGRKLQLLLTAEGQALAQRAQALSLQMEQAWLAPLSPGERALLRELLQKLGRSEGVALRP